MKQRIVVVGSGQAGLLTLRTLQKECNAEDFEIICYERKMHIGGEWVYSDENGEETFDKEGFTMKTSVYKGLQLNTPTTLLQPHPELAFPANTPLYPTMEQYLKYLQDFAAKFELFQYMQFGKQVCDIHFNAETSKFSYKVASFDSNDVLPQQCDFLFLCGGQNRIPRIPANVDLSTFKGQWLHYHNLQDPGRFFGKRILAVGASAGAMDMALIYTKPGKSASFHISMGVRPPFFISTFKEVPVHPRIVSADGNTVLFEDGTTVDVDVIIFTTGFDEAHPLSDELQLNFNWGIPARILYPLYKHIVHPKCPRLFFLTKSHLLALSMTRIQAEFCCKVIKGSVKLPSEADMLDDIAKFQAYWLDQLPKAKDFATFFPPAEIDLAVTDAVANMAGVDSIHPVGFAKHIVYQYVSTMVNDAANFKNYVVEYRPDPNDKSRQLPYFVPPKVEK